MYRLTLLMALLSIGNCFWDGSHHHGGGNGHGHGHGHGHGQGHRHGHGQGCGHGPRHDDGKSTTQKQYDSQDSNETKFDKLSSYFIDADRYVNNLCKDNTEPQVQEFYGGSTYKLIYAIPSNDVKDVTVQIKNRAIYMSADLLGENGTKLTNVRTLPSILNIKEAIMSHMDDQLTVEIPYSITFDAETKPVCGDVNEDVITVPVGGLGLRFKGV